MKEKNMEQLLKKLKSISGGKILDVATGQGEFINALMKSLKDYDCFIGVDNSDKAVKYAAEQFKEKRVHIDKMDAERMGYRENTFDTVGISNSLHHFKDISKVLDGMRKVLKPEGFFFISEMFCDEGQTEEQKTHIKMHHWWGKIDTKLGIVHKKTIKKDKIKEIVNKLDLKDVESYEFAYPVKNPKEKKIISRLLEHIDPYVDRLKEHKDYPKLKKEGGKIKERLQKVGFAPASILFVIGKK